MKLDKIAKIQSGYISRGKIDPREDGTCLLMQAKDVSAGHLSYRTDALVRFMPTLSAKDWFLMPGDILFMARGARNFSVLIDVFLLSGFPILKFYRNICAGTSTSCLLRNTSNVSAVGEFICRWSNEGFWKVSISRFRR